MPLADPHCHTTASDGMVTPKELVDAAVSAHLDLIAVTDHDTMAGVKEAQERGGAVGLTVVAGQEVTTKWPAQTHVIGWFLERPVKRGMSLEDSVAAIHDQGGLAIIPHPFMPVYFASMQPGMLRRLLERHRVDGIEMLFTAPIGPSRRAQLEKFYMRNSERLGAALGGSDCHFGAHDIGRVVTSYEGDFRTAIQLRTTEPKAGSGQGRIPIGLALRQQWTSLVKLPVRRLSGEL
jgi:hypothetical protein